MLMSISTAFQVKRRNEKKKLIAKERGEITIQIKVLQKNNNYKEKEPMNSQKQKYSNSV